MPILPAAPAPAVVRAAVVLLAAGDGRRVGGTTNKVLLPLAGLPVFGWSLRAIEPLRYDDPPGVAAAGLAEAVAVDEPEGPGVAAAAVDVVVVRTVVVVREQDRAVVTTTIADQFPDLAATIVSGGATRHGSEWNALCAVADAIDCEEIDVVAIHDAARPLADTGLFSAVIRKAAEYGGALPVRRQSSLVARGSEHRDSEPDPAPVSAPGPSGAAQHMTSASGLVAVQTPQAFRARPLLDAYRAAARDGFVGTDTASCVEQYTDLAIFGVPCPATNLKVTFPEDVALAERLLHKSAD